MKRFFKTLSFFLTLLLLMLAVDIASIHTGGGSPHEETTYYWIVLSIKLMADIMISKGV